MSLRPTIDPVAFADVIAAEQRSINARRNAQPDSGRPTDPPKDFSGQPLLGVGLSGGGIRSATFNLGLLQRFADIGLVPQIDYLSTVSGGGYIGSWLHGLIQRRGVRGALEVLRSTRQPAPAKEDPLTWLRKYSNYLAPKTGVFSKDTWVLGSLWLRNFVLNQCVLLPVIAAMLLLPVLIGFLPDGDTEWRWYVSGFLLLVAVIGNGVQLNSIATRELRGTSVSPKSKLFDAGISALLLCLSSVALGWSWTNPLDWPEALRFMAAGVLAVLFLLLQWTGGFVRCHYEQHKTPMGWLMGALLSVIFGLVCAAVTAGLLMGVFNLLEGSTVVVVRAWAPVLIAAAIMTGVMLLIGLMGADYPDSCREWLSRTGAVVAMMATAWAATFTIAVFLPPLIFEYWASAKAGAAGWLTTTGFGLAAGNSGKTAGPVSAQSESPSLLSKLLEFLARIAPPVFALGYAVAIAVGSFAALYQWPFLLTTRNLFFLTSGLGLTGLLMSSRLNVNEFSIHHLYKNRLVRCYLGATKADRQPNAWTGFDGQDDLKLTDLRASGEAPYTGPYPIINTAVNLNSGAELATQDRKAASFFVTPEFCGFVPRLSRGMDARGFVPTDRFLPGGPALGTAMAISGAAANPNMGYHTSGPMAFLLTVFNIRLGWWVGNPLKGTAHTDRTGPRSGLLYLFKELLGITTAKSSYVNLSDGGHFDNLGLYELVRRGCDYIVISDAEQDGEYAFGSLAMAIRRCRADFGVDVILDMDRVCRKSAHAVVGQVQYSPDKTGTILYIKSSVTGDEPQDIREYQARFHDFPHQSTGDQFFDEAQFESYRQLGLHVGTKVFEGLSEPVHKDRYVPDYLPTLFRELEQRWYAPSAIDSTLVLRHAEAYSALMERLAGDPELAQLDPAFLPGIPAVKRTTSPEVARRERYFCIECIQLMENVYTDLRLAEDREWLNPANQGWVNVFCHWASLPQFADAWIEVETTYNCNFRRFYNSLATRERAAATCA